MINYRVLDEADNDISWQEQNVHFVFHRPFTAVRVWKVSIVTKIARECVQIRRVKQVVKSSEDR